MINVLEQPDVTGDGLADDREGIQRVIGEAQDGEVLYFPLATYRLNDILYANRKNRLTLCGPGTLFAGGPHGIAMKVSGSGLIAGSIHLRGLSFHGTVVVNESHNVRIEQCHFSGPHSGIPGVRLFGTHDVTVENCTFDGRRIGVESHAPDTALRGNLFRDCEVAIKSTSAAMMIDHNRMFPFPGRMQTGILLDGEARWMNLIQITNNHIGYPSGFAISSPETYLDRNACFIEGNQFMQDESVALVNNVEMVVNDQQILRGPKPS